MTSTEKSAAANALNACLAACERVIESQGVFEGIDFHALKKGVERGLASLPPADPGAVAKRLEFAFREGFNDAATFKDVETAWKLSTVAALASSPSSAPAESGWQPIETAPKGCNVLVGYWNRLGKWRTVKACYYPPQTLELHEDHDLDEDSDGYAPEGWYEETETHEVTLPLECDPARWMPLPAAPQAVQAGGEGGNGLLAQPLILMWTLASAAWVLGGAALLRVAVPGWPRIPRGLRLVGGLLALWVAWLAAVQARMIGINFLLSILVLVWVADVFAYFAGRAFGLKFTRSKLAPAISPGKSWEGVWGGMIGVVVLAFAWVWADKATGATVASLYTRLADRGWWLLLLAALFLAAMSVVGDLVESLIKRSAGAKDSSRLLPGHGGVLDRVDALLPALPIAMMLAFL